MDFTEPKDTKKAKKVIGRPFQKGQSGNPGGKRKGTRNAATLAAEALFDGESAALTRKAIAMAKAGDMAAMRLAMERIIAPRRERPLQFELPSLKTAEDAMAALARIAAGVRQGELSDSEARTLIGLVHTFLEGLALWMQRPLSVVLCAADGDDTSALGLSDGFGFGCQTVHYEVEVVDPARRPRGLGSFRDLRQLGLRGVR